MYISTIKTDEKFRWQILAIFDIQKDSTFTEVLCLRDHAVTVRSVTPPSPVGLVLSQVMHFCGGGGQALHLQGLQIPVKRSLKSPAGLSTPFSEPLTDSRVHGHPWFTDRWELLLNLPPVNSFRTPWQPCHTSRSWGSIWRLMTHIWAIWTLLTLKMCAAVGIVEARCSADNPL